MRGSARARTRLLKGCDQAKDQSYFLHAVPAQALAHTLFPIGDLHKDEVRRRAQELALNVFDKKDSTGICFIGERPFAQFLSQYLPAQPGPIETPDGRCVGRHDGLMFYTLGQRQGLGIGGRFDAEAAPWYVADKDVARNVLIVVQGHDHAALQSNTATAAHLTWVSGRPPADRFTCSAKVRYRQQDQPCEVTIRASGECELRFDSVQRAVTPGQYVVFYAGDECLGGGVIEATAMTLSVDRPITAHTPQASSQPV